MLVPGDARSIARAADSRRTDSGAGLERLWRTGDCGGRKITCVVIAEKSLGKFMGFYRKGDQRNSKKALTPGSKHSLTWAEVSAHLHGREK